MILEILVVIAIVALASIELGSYLWTRVFPINPSREFVKLDSSIIDRFVTFDADLGHVPTPNTKKVDRDITGKHYEVICTYDELASRASQFDTSIEVMGSAFGDSFCQCRGVQDNETWQAYLEAKTGKRILNFGVGGYGLDQAYLRYLRIRDWDLGKMIIFAVSPCTIERVISVYKHYIEFGNYLGIKPRFVEIDGQLQRVALPVQSKADLQELARCKRQIRALDENYEGYFKKYRPAFPFAYFVLRNWKQYLIDIIGIVLGRQKWTFPAPVSTFLHQLKTNLVADRRNEAYRRKNEYFRKLFAEKENFFISLVRECKKACEKDRRAAFLVILPDYTNISFMRNHEHYYKKIVERLRHEVGIPVFDSFEIFRDCDPQEIFLKDNYSGHQTAQGNASLAEHLARFLGERKVPNV